MTCFPSRSVRIGLALLATLGLSACSSIEAMGPAQDYSPKLGNSVGQYPIHGIDVSKYQGAIDWHAAAKSGVRFAYIKATEGGDRKDDRFEENWAGARAAGIPTGAYHFYYFCRPVEDQIAWFQTHVPPARDALPPVLDMEWNHLSPTCKLRPPAAQVRADMARFLNAMERFYGKKPIIYTTIDFHRDVLNGDALGFHGFWLRSVASHPDEKYDGRRWTFWQYTATGSVPGVRGRVDRNVFAGDEADWRRFLTQGTAVADATPVPPAADAAPALAQASPAPASSAGPTPTVAAYAPVPTPPAAPDVAQVDAGAMPAALTDIY